MGQTTPNIGIYVPSAGETNYDQSFLAGMLNVDAHDHSGGPNKGVPIGTSGLDDDSVTYEKLNSNVADTTTGIGTQSGGFANRLEILGLLKNIYQLVTAAGFISKDGSTAYARTITGTANQVDVANGDGSGGNPTLSLPSTIYTNISFDSGTNTLQNYVDYTTFTPTITSATPDTVTYNSQLGHYIRIGNMAFVFFQVGWTAIGTNSGDLKIASLPFTIKNAGPRPIGACSTSGATFDAGYTALAIAGNQGSTTADVVEYGTATGDGALDIWASGSIQGSLMYVID